MSATSRSSPATSREGRTHSAGSLFALYAAVSLIIIVVIGAVLAGSYRAQADERGLAEGTANAILIAQSTFEPIIAGHDLSTGVDHATRKRLTEVTDALVDHATLLRLRLRNLSGHVVFTNDGSGLSGPVEDEVLEAAEGHTQASLTRLNTDTNDTGAAGVAVVEIYTAVRAGAGTPVIGVLEMYLPYAPIATSIHAGQTVLYRALAGGLSVLYLVQLALCLATTRGLRRHAARNAYLADHNLLTGLANRRVFHRRLQSSMAPTTCAAIVNVARFTDVNNTIGHRNGDVLLQQLGARLVDSVLPGDEVFHLGGDEFGVILRSVRDQDAARSRLRDLSLRVAEPIEVDGVPLTIDSNIGFVIADRDGTDGDTLIRRADIALSAARSTNAGIVHYTPDQDHFDPEKLAVVSELTRAIAHDELVLHYQPKLRLADSTVTGVEALVRWNHPRRGMLYPDAFVPAVEQTDLIDPFTDWVLARAVGQLRQWHDQGLVLSMSVNISARNLSNPLFVAGVHNTIETSGILAQYLVLEVTETAVLEDIDRVVDVLTSLTGLGVRISLDDFGQGQTSLSFLTALPLSELKLDRVFVKDLQSPGHNAVVRQLVELCHTLGFKIVAEGVEDEAARTILTEMGCDEMQGYLLSRPQAPQALEQWLQGRRRAEAPLQA